MPQKKLSKTSKAVRLLRSMFEPGEITGAEDPKDVWENKDLFKEHRLTNFRTCYDNLRKEFAKIQEKETPDDTEKLRRRCSAENSGSAKKRRTSELLSDVEDLDDGDVKAQGSELLSHELRFKPLYSAWIWSEPGTMTQRVTVSIILPSGVGVGSFFVRVVDGGEYLELIVRLPEPPINPEVMHRKWLRAQGENGIQVYHPKIIGFQTTLKQLRQRSSDLIESVARIPLPIPVQTHVEGKYNLMWRDYESKMVYVALKAFIEDYAVTNDVDDFEVL